MMITVSAIMHPTTMTADAALTNPFEGPWMGGGKLKFTMTTLFLKDEGDKG